MSSDSSKRSLIASRIRAVARVWSILVWLLALVLIIGTRKSEQTYNLANDPLDIIIPVSLLISLVGLGIAWRWEGWGIWINISFYLAIIPIYWIIHREWIQFSIMVGLSPVILPGMLFLAAWIISNRK